MCMCVCALFVLFPAKRLFIYMRVYGLLAVVARSRLKKCPRGPSPRRKISNISSVENTRTSSGSRPEIHAFLPGNFQHLSTTFDNPASPFRQEQHGQPRVVRHYVSEGDPSRGGRPQGLRASYRRGARPWRHEGHGRKRCPPAREDLAGGRGRVGLGNRKHFRGGRGERQPAEMSVVALTALRPFSLFLAEGRGLPVVWDT